MSVYINTALTLQFLMISDTTGQNIASSPIVQISQNGATYISPTNAPVAVSGVTGAYSLLLVAADTNCHSLHVVVTGAGAVTKEWMIYPESDWSASRASLIDNGGAGASGTGVAVDMGQAVNRNYFAGTLGRVLQIMRAEGHGGYIIDNSANTLTVYDSDNTTVIAVFTLTPSGGPYTQRQAASE